MKVLKELLKYKLHLVGVQEAIWDRTSRGYMETGMRMLTSVQVYLCIIECRAYY
jgi:hypothetical protein